MGLIENLSTRFENEIIFEPAVVMAETAKATQGEGPRPCSRCAGRLFWTDVAARLHCIVCNEPPDVIFVQNYFFLRENDDGEFYTKKLFIDPRETIPVRNDDGDERRPRHPSPMVPRWSLPAEASRCGAWASGLCLQGVWAQDKAHRGPESEFVRVD